MNDDFDPDDYDFIVTTEDMVYQIVDWVFKLSFIVACLKYIAT